MQCVMSSAKKFGICGPARVTSTQMMGPSEALAAVGVVFVIYRPKSDAWRMADRLMDDGRGVEAEIGMRVRLANSDSDSRHGVICGFWPEESEVFVRWDAGGGKGKCICGKRSCFDLVVA